MSVPAGPPPESALRTAGRTVARIWTHPGRRPRVSGLSRYFAWQLWQRTIRRPWTVELIDGIRIRCYPHSPAASAVIYYGLADHAEMHFLRDYLRPGDTFVDVGANVGVYSLLACSVPGVSVVALEPSAKSFARARENIALNGLEYRVRLIRAAAGAAARTAMFTTGLDVLNRLLDEGSQAPAEPVEVTTLDALGLERVALIKIDVEGWEAEVLEGARALIDSHRPVLIVEFNQPAELERIRRSIGYKWVDYRPGSRSLEESDPTGRIAHNLILVPDLESARARLAAGGDHQGSKHPA